MTDEKWDERKWGNESNEDIAQKALAWWRSTEPDSFQPSEEKKVVPRPKWKQQMEILEYYLSKCTRLRSFTGDLSLKISILEWKIYNVVDTKMKVATIIEIHPFSVSSKCLYCYQLIMQSPHSCFSCPGFCLPTHSDGCIFRPHNAW